MAGTFTDAPDTVILITASGLLTATPFTTMQWVRPTVANSSTPMGVWSSDLDGQRAWRLRMNADPSPRAQVSFDGATATQLAHASTLALNVWAHIGMDFDGSTLRIFVDGVLSNSVSLPGTIFSSSRNLGLAGYDDGGGTTASELDGDLEDFRYYNRILDVKEWATINKVRGLDGIVHGLVTQWPINERPKGTVITASDVKDIGPAQLAVSSVVGSPTYITGELRQRKAA